MHLADMPGWFPIVMIVVYLIFSARNASKKKKMKEEQRQRQQHPETGTPTAEKPGSLEDVLTKMFQEVETKTKPYGRPEQQQKRQILTPKKNVQLNVPNIKPIKEKKKDPKPFLSEDYTPETIEQEGAPSHLTGTMPDDGFKRGSVTNFDYNAKVEENKSTVVNLRDALVGQIILQRPEW